MNYLGTCVLSGKCGGLALTATSDITKTVKKNRTITWGSSYCILVWNQLKKSFDTFKSCKLQLLSYECQRFTTAISHVQSVVVCIYKVAESNYNTAKGNWNSFCAIAFYIHNDKSSLFPGHGLIIRHYTSYPGYRSRIFIKRQFFNFVATSNKIIFLNNKLTFNLGLIVTWASPR